MDFSGHLDDAKLQLVSAGFSDELWIPEFGWENDTEAAEMKPHPAQLLAAIQLFLQIYIHGNLRIWAHLAAEFQAGKTGVVTAFIRLVLSNVKKLKIRPNRIFVITGMSDNAWKKQTRTRMPFQVRDNVNHSGGLSKVATSFHRLCETAKTPHLSDIIVILDESHIASSKTNKPNLHIWGTLKELCPIELWQEKNIRVITISATDPSKVLCISELSLQAQPASVVRLQTTDAYQSIQSLVDSNRIRFVEEFGDVHTKKAAEEIKRVIETGFGNEPLYHILRPRNKKDCTLELERNLREKIPNCQIISWDATNKKNKKCETASSSSLDLNDINALLSEEPDVTTFIILKNMLYAAKTLDDRHVGIMYDRIGGKDDTNLQSLVGRACGYGRSKRTIIYTSRQTIDNYLQCWRELCSNTNSSRVYEIPTSRLNKRMVGIRAKNGLNGKESSELFVEDGFQTPIGQTEQTKESSDDEAVIEETVFESGGAAKEWGKTNLNQGVSVYGLCDQDKKKGFTHFRYRGQLRPIMDLESTKGSEFSWGLGKDKKGGKNTGRPRAMPVLVDGKIKYIVVYKRFMLK